MPCLACPLRGAQRTLVEPMQLFGLARRVQGSRHVTRTTRLRSARFASWVPSSNDLWFGRRCWTAWGWDGMGWSVLGHQVMEPAANSIHTNILYILVITCY